MDKTALWPDSDWLEAQFCRDPGAMLSAYQAGLAVENALPTFAQDLSSYYYALSSEIEPLSFAAACRITARAAMKDVAEATRDELEIGENVALEKPVFRLIAVPEDPAEVNMVNVAKQQQKKGRVIKRPEVSEDIMLEEYARFWRMPGEYPKEAKPPEVAGVPAAARTVEYEEPKTFEEMRIGVLRGLMAYAVTAGLASFTEHGKGGYAGTDLDKIIRSPDLSFLSSSPASDVTALAYSVGMLYRDPSKPTPPRFAHESYIYRFLDRICNLPKSRYHVAFPLVDRTADEPLLLPTILEVSPAQKEGGPISLDLRVLGFYSSERTMPTQKRYEGLLKRVDNVLLFIKNDRKKKQLSPFVYTLTVYRGDVIDSPLSRYGTFHLLQLLALARRANVVRTATGKTLEDLAAIPDLRAWSYGRPDNVSDPNDLILPGKVTVKSGVPLYRLKDPRPHGVALRADTKKLAEQAEMFRDIKVSEVV